MSSYTIPNLDEFRGAVSMLKNKERGWSVTMIDALGLAKPNPAPIDGCAGCIIHDVEVTWIVQGLINSGEVKDVDIYKRWVSTTEDSGNISYFTNLEPNPFKWAVERLYSGEREVCVIPMIVVYKQGGIFTGTTHATLIIIRKKRREDTVVVESYDPIGTSGGIERALEMFAAVEVSKYEKNRSWWRWLFGAPVSLTYKTSGNIYGLQHNEALWGDPDTTKEPGGYCTAWSALLTILMVAFDGKITAEDITEDIRSYHMFFGDHEFLRFFNQFSPLYANDLKNLIRSVSLNLAHIFVDAHPGLTMEQCAQRRCCREDTSICNV